MVTSSSTSKADRPRPGGVGDQALALPERRPGLLGKVRHHRRGEQQHRRDRRAAIGRGRRLLDRAGQLVDVGDRLVEGERLDVARRPRRWSGGACARALSSPGPPRPAPNQPPQPLDEPPAPLIPPRSIEVALGRAVGQQEPAHGVGAVLVDDRLGIDRRSASTWTSSRPPGLDRLAGRFRSAVAVALDLVGADPAAVGAR